MSTAVAQPVVDHADPSTILSAHVASLSHAAPSARPPQGQRSSRIRSVSGAPAAEIEAVARALTDGGGRTEVLDDEATQSTCLPHLCLPDLACLITALRGPS